MHHARPTPSRAARATAARSAADLGALLRFKSLMSVDGQSVNVARMCFDRGYAYERIATAHGSASDLLRRSALALFQHYQAHEAGQAA